MSTTWRDSRFGPGSYEYSSQEDRCAPRTAVRIAATLRPSAAKSFPTTVHDLSLGGFSATALNRMHVGTICWLSLPGLASQQAEVAWWQNGMVGCAFANLLSPIVLDSLLSQYQSVGR